MAQSECQIARGENKHRSSHARIAFLMSATLWSCFACVSKWEGCLCYGRSLTDGSLCGDSSSNSPTCPKLNSRTFPRLLLSPSPHFPLAMTNMNRSRCSGAARRCTHNSQHNHAPFKKREQASQITYTSPLPGPLLTRFSASAP